MTTEANTVRPSQVQVHTATWEGMNGRKPGGKARWGFHLKGEGYNVFWAPSERYGQAKKDAQGFFAAMGERVIYVAT
jgi:hypothetical protein